MHTFCVFIAFNRSPPVNLGFIRKRLPLDVERLLNLENREFDRPLEKERPLLRENERPLLIERPLLPIVLCLFFLKVLVTAITSLWVEVTLCNASYACINL